MPIGDLIKRERRAAGLTQEELAEKLGLKKAVVSHWEVGVRVPGRHTLRKLAGILNLDITALMQMRAAGPATVGPDPMAARTLRLVGELADPVNLRMLELFCALSRQQRQNILDLVEMATKIAREGQHTGDPTPVEPMTA